MGNKKNKILVCIVAVSLAVVLVAGGFVFLLEKGVFPPKKPVEDNQQVAATTTPPHTTEVPSTTLPALTTEPPREGFVSIIDTTYAYDYTAVADVIKLLQARYSNTIKLYTLCNSTAGKPIPLMTIGSGEKKALVTGGLHAREHITTKYLLRCIDEFCYSIEKGNGMYGGYDLKQLFSEYTLYVVPCLNPDGLDIILSKLAVKPGVGVDALEEYKSNYNGVDLNRNFPLAWDGIDNGVTEPFCYFFRGYQSASEVETQAIMALCEQNEFDFMLSMHVKGNCIYWGDKYNTEHNKTYRAFAKDIADVADLYITTPTPDAKGYGGGFENWFRHTYSKPGLCVELMAVEDTIKPCTNENYKNFDKTVNYEKTKFIIPAAMLSKNK